MKGIISIILFRSLFATIINVTNFFFFPCALGFTTTSFQSFNRVIIRQTTISISRMSSTTTTNSNNDDDEPRWCPEEQIYIGGVPENAEVKELIQKEGGYLRLFGYGSLCWNPGGGVLANSKVTSKLGRARGYRRCWAQKSTDHRGTTKFPGIVCTLLADSEVDHIRQEATAVAEAVTQTAEEERNHHHHHHHGNDHHDQEATMTEGVIYLIPPNLVDECLEELDFREKGGYARDVIDVIEDETGELHQALLYRGTPDNPAFWSRALLDLDYAAATMSVAVGPSGKNDVYLNSLDEFLRNAHTIAAEKDDTNRLSAMARKFQTDYQPYFLYGCGSNQHNQLLLDRPNNAANLRGDDCHEMKEILVCTRRTRVSETTTTTTTTDKPKAIYAGGGHSGLLTTSGNLYLWGWNESGQCSTTTIDSTTSKTLETESSLPLVSHLSNLSVEKAALGFSHTLIVERETNQLYTFGNNERGQVDGNPSTTPGSQPTVPPFLKDERIKAVAAGLFHSAVVTMDGEVIAFGCSRFGQALSTKNEKGDAWIDSWRPNDGSKAVDVVCGRRHTLVVDDRNRIWSFGENKYGQLGRQTDGKFDPTPALVDGCVKDFPQNSIIHLNSGWSHNVIRVELVENGDNFFYGWGRNDKGQLGTGKSDESSSMPTPRIIFEGKELQLASCSSESTLALDRKGRIFGCGWNEHGNLATGDQEDKLELHLTVGEKVVSPPVYDFDNPTIAIAAGGAHFLSCIVEKTNLS